MYYFNTWGFLEYQHNVFESLKGYGWNCANGLFVIYMYFNYNQLLNANTKNYVICKYRKYKNKKRPLKLSSSFIWQTLLRYFYKYIFLVTSLYLWCIEAIKLENVATHKIVRWRLMFVPVGYFLIYFYWFSPADLWLCAVNSLGAKWDASLHRSVSGNKNNYRGYSTTPSELKMCACVPCILLAYISTYKAR